MLRMISSILAIALMLTFSLATASATSICTDGTTDVLSWNAGGGCNMVNGPVSLLFSEFEVTDNNPNKTYVIGVNGALSGGPNNALRFTIAPAFGPSDILLSYKVSVDPEGSGIGAVLGTYHGDVSVTEVACKVKPVNGICPQGQKVGSLLVYPEQEVSMLEFMNPLTSFYLIKDISIPEGNAMSDFANEHLTEGQVPEPETFALMGAGLIGLAFLKCRKV